MASNMKDVFETMFTKMENFVSTKTVVGEAIHVGDVTLLPLIDVTFGLGAGGGDGKSEKNDGGGAGGGLGAKITPSAVIVITNSTVQLVNVKNQDSVNKLVDMVPGIVSKLNFGSMFSKKDKAKDAEEDIKFEEQTFTE